MWSLNCKQSKKMSNSKYFRNQVEVFILLGDEPGTWTSCINAVLVIDAINVQAPTDDEKTDAAAKAREEYLAVLFISNYNVSKYGKRVLDLKVKCIEGTSSDPYPITLARALEMLEIWDEVFRRSKRNRSTMDESGIAYASTNEDLNNRSHFNTGFGRSGRSSGRERGYGRGRRGHKGRGLGNRRNEGDKAHHTNYNNDDNKGIFKEDDCNDNYISDNYINQQFNPYSSTFSYYSIFDAQCLKNNTINTLIIDSASTVDIIGNKHLLYNTHDALTPLHMRTVNSSTTIRKKGFLGLYPYPV